MTTGLVVLALVLAAAPGKEGYQGPTGGLRVTLKHGADPVSARELRVTCFPKDAAGKTLFVRGGPQQTDARGQAVAPSQNLKVTLAPGAYVTGRVRDAEGSVRKYEAELTNPEFFKENYARALVGVAAAQPLGRNAMH